METREGVILLVEDNPGDEALTLRALKRNDIKNEVVIARNGPEALDYLFGSGIDEGCVLTDLAEIIILAPNDTMLDH